MSGRRLSIVIVSYNAREALIDCLRSLGAAPPAIDHEIVVVDNASDDGSAAAAGAVPRVKVIELPDNRGFAAANNAAIRATQSEFILLLNSDTIVPAGAVDALVKTLEADPAVGVVGPRLVDAAGEPELSFGAMISPWNEYRQKHRSREWIARETAREQAVDWVSGACLAVRRKDAEAAGLLDERFFLYTEDVDFCHAIRRLGRKVLFTPVTTITHLRGQSRASRRDGSQRAYRASQVAFYRKHHPAYVPLLQLYLRLKGEL
jgi:GT2 family glycosyltransferase